MKTYGEWSDWVERVTYGTDFKMYYRARQYFINGIFEGIEYQGKSHLSESERAQHQEALKEIFGIKEVKINWIQDI